MFDRINELSTKAYVRATSLATTVTTACPLLTYRPKTRADKFYYALGFGLSLTVCSFVSFAQDASGGVAGMTQAAGTQADAVKATIGKFLGLFGLLAVAGGVFNLIRKGKEGDNSHIKGSHIFVPILGGALLGAAGVLVYKSAETVGLQDGDVGNSAATGG